MSHDGHVGSAVTCGCGTHRTSLGACGQQVERGRSASVESRFFVRLQQKNACVTIVFGDSTLDTIFPSMLARASHIGRDLGNNNSTMYSRAVSRTNLRVCLPVRSGRQIRSCRHHTCCQHKRQHYHSLRIFTFFHRDIITSCTLRISSKKQENTHYQPRNL